MGQKIKLKTTSFNKNIIFDLNRSLSGQDGVTYHNIADASLHDEVSAQLALKLFQFIMNQQAQKFGNKRMVK